MAGYNLTRSVEELLEKTESSIPSFTVHLHSEVWILNNGSKFLYNNQVASLLDDIRAHRIPVDFLELFDAAKVPFYDGCMIVELLDYRPQRNKENAPERPEKTRVVLHPNVETIWADICLLNQKAGNKWTDNDILEIEARLLLATTPSLCLDPDPHLTRIANHVLRVSTPTVPVSLKRKAVALDPEEDETDKARRAKIMHFMNPRPNRSHVPSYRILDAIQRSRILKEGTPSQNPQSGPQPMPPPIVQPVPPVHPPAPRTTPVPSTPQDSSPAVIEDSTKRLKPKKKGDPSQSPYSVADRGNATPTPQPNGSHLQQQNQLARQSPRPVSQSPLQPPVYAAVQAAADPGKRVSSPAQRHFSQSPQVQPSQPAPSTSHPPQPQHTQPSSSTTFQPPLPAAHFLNPPPQGRNGQTKASPHNIPVPQPTPQQANVPRADPQMQQMYNFHLAAQQRMNAQASTGRSTPQGPPIPRSPMNPNQGTAPRSSPSQTARSPMPSTNQPVPQMTHPQQHLNFSVAQNQYNAGHLRMAHPNGSPHPQSLSSHLVAGGAQPSPSPAQTGQQSAPSQDQAHPLPMAQYPAHIFGYPQMFTMQPRTGFAWQSMNMRGQPMPTAALPQQMSKAPGTLPGR